MNKKTFDTVLAMSDVDDSLVSEAARAVKAKRSRAPWIAAAAAALWLIRKGRQAIATLLIIAAVAAALWLRRHKQTLDDTAESNKRRLELWDLLDEYHDKDGRYHTTEERKAEILATLKKDYADYRMFWWVELYGSTRGVEYWKSITPLSCSPTLPTNKSRQ